MYRAPAFTTRRTVSASRTEPAPRSTSASSPPRLSDLFDEPQRSRSSHGDLDTGDPTALNGIYDGKDFIGFIHSNDTDDTGIDNLLYGALAGKRSNFLDKLLLAKKIIQAPDIKAERVRQQRERLVVTLVDGVLHQDL